MRRSHFARVHARAHVDVLLPLELERPLLRVCVREEALDQRLSLAGHPVLPRDRQQLHRAPFDRPGDQLSSDVQVFAVRVLRDDLVQEFLLRQSYDVVVRRPGKGVREIHPLRSFGEREPEGKLYASVLVVDVEALRRNSTPLGLARNAPEHRNQPFFVQLALR